MTFKNISKTKLSLALVSLVITFFVWQQGLRDSLSRPSVSFDISQKEYEIVELASQSIPTNLQKFFIINDPVDEINDALSKVAFNEMTERNKLIQIISSNSNQYKTDKNIFKDFENENYNLLIDEIEKKSNNNSYKANFDKFDLLKDDRFIYHLLSKKFDFDDSSIITKSFSSKMFLKIIAIRLIPLLTILIGSILALKTLWKVISLKKFGWKEIKPLDLELIDMVLLIGGGFVVLGEVVSPLFSISLVELFSKNISNELSQSLKIFFGYLFMATPPLLIVYYQIKSLNGEFILKQDYFQFNFLPIKDAIIQGIKGWLTIVPFVLLVSLIMNSLIETQNGSNPLLEIVLNNNNYLSFILLFVTTTLIAPLFEEIIFRGILLPTLSRDFGIILGIIVSAFIFALAHLSLGEMLPLFVLGIGLGITRIASGSLLSSVTMHTLWNGLTFLNLFLLRT
ncbi:MULTISPECIES: CPBP family intramembrane glutamic endopeptidase [Prochlorococcus]|uniref:Putative membrane associated protease n=1 Tax=Prochlorococcus marinus str. MIT 9116 TaxID=167544 RepID=A0A0A1ZSF7_PROMR|nr:CPBP family intramembrane glutamic endopeptidase [Prochlorococcus marinus]KGF91017.1 putative membrane associated protease [Prochlorococcus marinus str. MIT 9107]KGF91476.1 putative membrane associated protease [Prochlorococcus marinus str. MIT 9116]